MSNTEVPLLDGMSRAAGSAASIWTVRKPALAVFLLGVAAAQAGPMDGQVTSGAASISQSGANTTITQSSQNASLNWKSFNVGAQESVNFVQPSASAIAVNRIQDTHGSQILGQLNANGQIFLINPNGILFGAGAQVNVGGLVASTLDVKDADLTSGKRSFSGPGTGSVVNQGAINARTGGYVALIGNTVRNQGSISVPLGSVALGAGSAVTLTFQGNQLLKVEVDQSVLNSLAENGGLIVANGGQVLMSAGARDSLLASAVNNTGVIRARTVENRNGTIILLGGMAAGTANVAGTLDASAPSGGNGGFIETSGAHVKIADDARVTTAAPAGSNGTWLIDPVDFTIAATGGDITGAALSANLGGGNVVIQSSNGGAAGNGDINVNDSVSWGANTLTLTAARDINVNAVMTASGSSRLTLNTGTANGGDAGVSGGAVKVGMNPAAGGFKGRVDFGSRSGTGFLMINGNAYTVINSLGAAGSATGADLQGISGNLAGHYALGADIDASATSTWNAGAGFEPIGSSSNFTGTLNGLGHTVDRLVINRPSTNNVGLFGNLKGALSNIGMVGGSVTGQHSAGSLAGVNQTGGSILHTYSTAHVTAMDEGGALVGINRSTITGSYATGDVDARYDVGGLVGWNENGTISKSYATGNVSASSDYVGGLVGYSDGAISNSYATGNASTTAAIAGGLVGGTGVGGTVSHSYATGNVTSTDASGGLVGYNDGAAITDAYATGNVNAINYGAGGLVGRNFSGTISNAYATGSVTSIDRVGGLVGENVATVVNTYATGSVAGTTNVGGLIGRNTSGAVTASYWNKETSGQATSAGLASTFAKTTAEMMQASTFASWNLSAVGGSSAAWRIYEGHTFPLLRSFLTGLTLANTAVTYNGAAQAGAAVPFSGLLSGTSASGRDVGSYIAYSHQQGYDLSGGGLTVMAAPVTASVSSRLVSSRLAPVRLPPSSQEVLPASAGFDASSTVTVSHVSSSRVDAGAPADQKGGEGLVSAETDRELVQGVGPSLRIVDGGVKLLNKVP